MHWMACRGPKHLGLDTGRQRHAAPAAALCARTPPVEGVWLYLRERHLSHRLHHSYQAILDAACDAWRRVTPDRLQSLCACPWIE
jgi:hypothetical protein